MSSSLLELLRDILNRNIVKKVLPIITTDDNDYTIDSPKDVDEYNSDDEDILYYSSNHSDTLYISLHFKEQTILLSFNNKKN